MIKDKKAVGNARYEGTAVDMIAEIAKVANFTYTFNLVKGYGKKSHSGEWSGMVREIVDKVTYTCVDNY